MASYNKSILVGNLTRDVELRFLQSGTAVVDLGLAVNDKRKQGDEWVEDVLFIDVTFFGKTAEVCNQYLQKGSTILVEGRLKLDQWEQEGQRRSKIKLIGDRMQMLGGKSDPGSFEEKDKPAGRPAPPVTDDIPF